MTTDNLYSYLMRGVSMLQTDIRLGTAPTDAALFQQHVTENHTLLKETLKKSVDKETGIPVDLMLKLERQDILLAFSNDSGIISITFKNPIIAGSTKTFTVETY